MEALVACAAALAGKRGPVSVAEGEAWDAALERGWREWALG